MTKITSIKPTKQERAVVQVSHNGETIKHQTTLHIVHKYQLVKGMELSRDDYQMMIQETEEELLLQQAIGYISYQMRTISEVKKYLRKKTDDEQVIQRIINNLKAHNYLGDADYVRQYVDEKMQYDLVGPIYIKNKLIKKGIHFELIDAELIRFHADIEFAKVQELITKKISYTQRKPFYKLQQTLKRTCINKGFNINIVDAMIQSMKDEIQASIDEDSLIEKELKRLSIDASTYEGKQKLIQTLRRKGFSYETINNYVK